MAVASAIAPVNAALAVITRQRSTQDGSSQASRPPEVTLLMAQPVPAAVPGGQPPTQQPPFGTANATGPTPNKGFEAAGLQRLGSVVKSLEEMVPMFGAASEHGKEVLKALNILVKLVPAGSTTPASERSNIENMAMKNTQANAQMQALKQRQAQGGGAQPGMPPGAQAA